MKKSLSPVAEQLKSIFQKHGVTFDVTPVMYEQFASFYQFLMNYQKKYNLTRLKTFEDVAVKHFVDCIYVAQLHKIPSPIMDVGTGAGFPGVVFKILHPEVRVILAEGVQKKVEYLKELRDFLNLKELDILGRNIDPSVKYPVRAVTTRAVETAASTLRNISNSVEPGGEVILMKTPGIEDEVSEAQKEFGEQFDVAVDRNYQIKNTTHKRKLLVFTKKINPKS